MPSPVNRILFCGLLLAASSVLAHGGAHGDEDEATSAASSLTGTSSGHDSMPMFFHTTTSDTLWFEGWTPTSTGAVVGACFGLFFLAVFERFIAAMKGLSETHWKVIKAQTQPQTRSKGGYLGSKGDSESQHQPKSFLDLRRLPAFSLSRDISRAVLHAAQVTLAYLLMLAVMTYQVFFVIAIVLGAGIGELVFGRFASGSRDEGH